MSSAELTGRSRAFQIAWISLLIVSGLMTLNHLALIFFLPGEEVLFIGWAAFNIFSTVVLIYPYRSREKWAWYLMWVFVVANVPLILFDSDIGIYYLVVAGVATVAQLFTRPGFFGTD